MFIVPTPREAYPDETVSVALEGITYVIRWLYNEREGVWTFSISDVDDVPILSGVRVVQNVDLLELASDERRPPGAMMIIDATGSRVEPTLESFGHSARPVYIPADELAAL